MVLMSFRLGVCRAQRNFTSRVLPQPVSPITITGMLHLNTQWTIIGIFTWTHSGTITGMLHLNTQWDNHWDVAPEHTVGQSLGCSTWTHSGTIIGMLHLNTQWDNHRDAAPEHTVGQSLGCLPEQSEAIPLSKGCRCHCPKVVDATRLNSMGTCHKTKLYGYMPQD